MEHVRGMEVRWVPEEAEGLYRRAVMGAIEDRKVLEGNHWDWSENWDFSALSLCFKARQGLTHRQQAFTAIKSSPSK